MDSAVAMKTLRVFGFVLLFVLLPFAPSAVAATCYGNPYTISDQSYPSRQEAYQACMAAAVQNASIAGNRRTFNGCVLDSGSGKAYRHSYTINAREIDCSTHNTSTTVYSYFRWTSENCPSGSAWNETNKRCEATCPTGEWVDPTNPLQCLSQSKCLAKNADPALTGEKPRSWESRCLGGCDYRIQPGHTVTTLPGGAKLYHGRYEFSGNSCSVPDPNGEQEAKEDKPQECVPVAGQTVCVKKDGRHCYSASTGRQICWKPGETGDKPDGDTLQRRVAGPTEIPPNTQLPNGDTLTRSGNPITTTTTTNNTTITTTTTNYRTQHGTNAGNTNSGENANGTDDGEPDGEGDNGVAGDGCDKPPTCTLGESIGCAILMQTWKNDCTLRTAIAPNESDEPSDLSGLDGFEQAKQNLFDAEGEGVPGLDDIDSGGWAPSGSCPIAFSFTFWGRSYNLNDSRLCEVLDALAALVLVLGGIHSAYIFASGSRK